MNQSVWVVGAGGIGRVVAAYLADHGAVDVRLVPQRRTRVAQLSSGFTVHTAQRSLVVRPAVTALDDVAAVGDGPDCVVICVKGQDTERVIQAIGPRLRPDSVVVTIQNGLSAYRIAQWLGEARVLAAILAFDGTAMGSTTAVQHRADRRMVVGGFRGVDGGLLRRVVDILGACAPITTTNDLPTALWGKLISNAAANVVSAVTGVPVGAVMRNDAWLRWCVGLVAEGLAVAHAVGVQPTSRDVLGLSPDRFQAGLSGPDVDRLLADFAAAHQPVAALRSTMCRDLDDGRPTEVAWINGEIARRGRVAGIRTPLHDHATQMVQRLEAGQARVSVLRAPLDTGQLVHHNDQTKGIAC